MKSVTDGDATRVRSLLDQRADPSLHRISDDNVGLLHIPASNSDLKMTALLREACGMNTPKDLQHALVTLYDLTRKKVEDKDKNTVAGSIHFFSHNAQAMVEAGVVLPQPTTATDALERRTWGPNPAGPADRRPICRSRFGAPTMVQNNRDMSVESMSRVEMMLFTICVWRGSPNRGNVELLLKARVDPNVPGLAGRKCLRSPDGVSRSMEPGCTPLLHACLDSDVTTVKLLLEANASADTPAFDLGEQFGAVTPLSASYLEASPGCTKAVLDALGWRVSKTGLPALATVAPYLRWQRPVRRSNELCPHVCLLISSVRACFFRRTSSSPKATTRACSF
jgi:hypothetical protein